MSRPHLTVVLQSGIRLDANHLSIERDAAGAPVISFLCSGQRQTHAPAEIREVCFQASGATWCGACGQALTPDQVVVG